MRVKSSHSSNRAINRGAIGERCKFTNLFARTSDEFSPMSFRSRRTTVLESAQEEFDLFEDDYQQHPQSCKSVFYRQ